MNILRIIGICALTVVVGCSSMTESGLTKQELRAIRSAMAQHTKSGLIGFSKTSTGDVEVTTEAAETVLLRRSSEGWRIVSTRSEQWVAPKNL